MLSATADVGDIRHPGLVGKRRMEILRQYIRRHSGRGIRPSRLLEYSNHFCSDVMHLHQAGHPGVSTNFSLRLERFNDKGTTISVPALHIHRLDLFDQGVVRLLPLTGGQTAPGE